MAKPRESHFLTKQLVYWLPRNCWLMAYNLLPNIEQQIYSFMSIINKSNPKSSIKFHDNIKVIDFLSSEVYSEHV